MRQVLFRISTLPNSPRWKDHVHELKKCSVKIRNGVFCLDRDSKCFKELLNITKSKGLGDTVDRTIKKTANILSKVGINSLQNKVDEKNKGNCHPCSKTQDALNKVFPYS